MGDEPFLRSHCPGGEGCYCDGAEHVYVRERTVTPPRAISRSSRSRRPSNRAHGVETVTINKTNTHSTISTSSTASVEVTAMVTRRSSRGASAQPEPARRSQRVVRAETPADAAAKEYLAYSSDEEYEQFMNKPKTDYTYAHSVSYNVISPQHVAPPNMSRRCLHSPGGTPGGTPGLSRLDERYDLSLSSQEVRNFRREVASRVTTTTSTTAAKARLAADAAASASRASSAALLSSTSGADGDTSPQTELSSSRPGVLYRPAPNGSLYQISRGLDVDSGDEDWTEVQNNNVSKSSFLEHHRHTQETMSSRRTVRSVVLTLLYPFTYLWLAASGAGRRLLWRERPAPAPAPAAFLAPAPDTVDYRRLMRGVSQTTAAGATDGRYRLRSRAVHETAVAPPSLARRAATSVTSTVTSVTSTVVMVLWWPVQVAAAACSAAVGGVSSAGRSSVAWAHSVSESADLAHHSALLLHCLSPRTWARAAGRGLSAVGTAAGTTAGYLNPVSAAKSAWRRLDGSGRSAAVLGWLSPVCWARSVSGLVSGPASGAAGSAHRLSPLSWARSAALAVLSAVQWTGAAASSAAHWTAETVTGTGQWTAETVTGAGQWTAGAVSGAAKGTAGAVSGAGQWTAETVTGAAKGTAWAVAAAGRRVWSSVWAGAGGGRSPRSGPYGAVVSAGGGRRRLCLCLLPLLLLLLLLLIPLLWGLYCEDDPAVVREESAVLQGMKTVPVTAWTALRDTAAFIGTSTVGTASSVYGYLALLGSSALTAPTAAPVAPTAPPLSEPGPAPAAVPAVPAVSVPVPVPAAAVPSESLVEVYARLGELQTKLAGLQTDFQSCRAASEEAARPAAVRAALGLSSSPLLTAEQLAAAEQRQAEQLTVQLAAVRLQLDQRTAAAAEWRGAAAEEAAAQRAELETRLAQLEAAAGQLDQLQTVGGRTEQRAAGLAADLTQLQRDFSDLHRTLLVIQESLAQMRSCCNRTDPDWSALLSHRLRDLDNQLDGRLRVFADNIKEDLVSESVSAAMAGGAGGLSRADVISIARETVALYDADKTGKFDYALESAGGSVISTKCTESYNVKSARISVLGIPLWYPSNNPRTIIQPSMSPGECYAFRGQGYFVIALSRSIVPSGFVMEHIPRNLTPTAVIDSAPRNFTVLGLQDGGDQEGAVLGRYVYQESGPPLQEFTVQSHAAAIFPVVELRVHDNWGHREYTCLYRFRVHGRPDAADGRDGPDGRDRTDRTDGTGRTGRAGRTGRTGRTGRDGPDRRDEPDGQDGR